MKIQFVIPNSPVTSKGNSLTATRWSKICRFLGHEPSIRQVDKFYPDSRIECLIALHGWKSQRAWEQYKKLFPKRPAILMLTGTDIYDPPSSKRAVVQRTMTQADRIVVLQQKALDEIPRRLHKKTHVIFQSAMMSFRRPNPLRSCFEVTVAGHLRAVKDPFRAAYAARDLPQDSRIRIHHYGAALDAKYELRAIELMKQTKRYRWFGAYPHWKTVRRIARSQLFVLSSKAEGGAGVLSECIVAGVPVLASRVSGNVGVLGDDYPGLFAFRSTTELKQLMHEVEANREYRRQLKAAIQKRKPLFSPQREKQAIRSLLDSIAS